MNSSDPGWEEYVNRRLAEHRRWQEFEANRLYREAITEVRSDVYLQVVDDLARGE